MDGEPFQYVSGSFHYFRALPAAWGHRLKTMRAAGLNVIDTYVSSAQSDKWTKFFHSYVEWSLHNPHDGVYKWNAMADVEHFIEHAWDEGFYVILRPGPYICAERGNGGLPHWLFTKYPNIHLRTNNPDYKREISIWYSQLMSRMQRFFYGNGGPIIMIQVENEYGAFEACDSDYLEWLRDETEKYVDGKAVLFTTDIPDERIHCGKMQGVFATTDFGYDRSEDFGLNSLPSVPTPAKCLAYGEVELRPVAKLLNQQTLRFLTRGQTQTSIKPKTFEELDQYSGLVLYETKLPKIAIDPTLLTVRKLRDRALVFIDQYLVGTLSRENNIYSLPISGGLGSTLQILVENQGRINFNVANDSKGILGALTLTNLSGEGEELNNWNSTGVPLEEEDLEKLIKAYKEKNLTNIVEDNSTTTLVHGPTLYYGQFTVNEIGDTYLNTVGWGKGVAFVNGMSLGRYWPLVGPQLTIYVPNKLLKKGTNELVLIEYQRTNRSINSKTITVAFKNEAHLDG